MKLAGSCLAAAVLLSAAGAWAQASPAKRVQPPAEASSEAHPDAASDTPYATIVARNMFGLLPIPPPDPNAGQPPPEEPPKITLNGIMTIFGKDQALFKVENKAKPGQPQKDDAFVLAEGEREEDITVVKINHEDGIVTFDNHGTVQELTLVPAKEGGGGGRGGPGRGGPGGAIQRGNPMFPQPGGEPRNFPGRSFGAALPGGALNNGATGSSGNSALAAGGAGNPASSVNYLGGTPVNQNRVYQPVDEPDISPEQSAILLEAQRLQYLNSGNEKLANLLPTTPLTEQNLHDFQNGGGAPAH